MIDKILPPGVRCAEAFADPPGARLYPEEMAIVARAVAKRRREFSTARNCARSALRGLGVPPGPILTGERGAPQWPPGIVGSITHCEGYRAAAVARASDIVALGLDGEPNSALPDGVLEAVTLASERAQLPGLTSAAPDVCWDRLFFSAKESVYKAWYPLARRWLGFEDAQISIEPVAGTFRARLLIAVPVAGSTPLTGFTGRWLSGGGLLLTAIAVPARLPAEGSDDRSPDQHSYRAIGSSHHTVG